ncbi:hypothetical protein E4T56_gene1634 [Termitomyces sp. T112]|nr:hypothetical protein E4T56_gene1634 [Termitomyces sp. T112]
MYCSHECGPSHVPQNTDCPFTELSVAVAGPSGPPSGADATQPLVGVAPSTHSKSGIRPGVVRLVPEGSRVVQAEVMPEQFAEAVGRVRGPPTLEWCQAAAPCEFEEPALGVWEERDGAQRELDGVRREWDLAQKDKDVAVRTAAERLSHLQELEVWMVHLQARVEVATQQAGGSGVRETQQGSSAGEVQLAVERAQQREEWLANEAASGQRGVLHEWFPLFHLLSTDSGSIDWAREHHILLDGASAALGSIHDGLARMPGDLPPELGQGVMQMGRLLAGHWWRAMADPGAWWEMATDVGELLPGQPEVLAAVVAQLEVFMVGRVAGLGLEEEGE